MPIPVPLRVASVPADHVYVRHLAPPSGPSAVVAVPEAAPAPTDGGWRPSPVLDPAWLRQHAGAYDLVHVHFGFEHRSPGQLVEFVATLRNLGRPLVLTVHDLENPHLTDQRAQDEALGVLVPAAASVVTLTQGAARQIARRWGRRAQVLAHPHVVELERLARPRPRHDGFVVGLHAKRRANTDPDAALRALTAVVATLPGAALHPGHRRRLSDGELWDHLAGLDVLVLPYRFGTHSGFVEACHDLGTTVVAPRVGFLREQQAVLSYDADVTGSLARAVRRAYDERPSRRADPADRAAQREWLAAAHAALYVQALAGVAA